MGEIVRKSSDSIRISERRRAVRNELERNRAISCGLRQNRGRHETHAGIVLKSRSQALSINLCNKMEPRFVRDTPVGYSFGPFLLDPARRLLWRDGRLVTLTSRTFDILLLLLEHHGEIVEKDQLLSAIWGKTIVEEATVVRHVSSLRKALHLVAESARCAGDHSGARLSVRR